jgi:hypothetical protein
MGSVQNTLGRLISSVLWHAVLGCAYIWRFQQSVHPSETLPDPAPFPSQRKASMGVEYLIRLQL